MTIDRRHLPKDWWPLVEAIRAAGYTFHRHGSHWRAKREGRRSFTLPGSPSCSRALRNAIADAKREGIDL